jgi:hypothetical protein
MPRPAPEQPTCQALPSCDKLAVAYAPRSGRGYCEKHRDLAITARLRVIPLAPCDRCGEWRAVDLELRRGPHVRSLCPPCAELVDELIAEGKV